MNEGDYKWIPLEHEKLAGLATKIAAGITPRKFPDEFAELDPRGEITRIPGGKEVSMYRELEGVFVMIDGDRMFFNQPAFAKFIFYCAKAGVTEVAVPDAKVAKKAVKGLEQEIGNVTYSIESELDSLNLSEGEKREIIQAVLDKLGLGYYSDIVSREELW